jgi:hypothetical protein
VKKPVRPRAWRDWQLAAPVVVTWLPLEDRKPTRERPAATLAGRPRPRKEAAPQCRLRDAR